MSLLCKTVGLFLLLECFRFDRHRHRFGVSSFLVKSTPTRTANKVVANTQSFTRVSRLFDIAEWRDMDFEDPNPNRKLTASSDSLPRQICILPFPFTDVLLQGETKQLRLYEDRFIHLFEDCIENHAGMVAMGLLADPFGGGGIIQTVPLCEIQAYNRMEEFGIFVTIRVVGRARLLDIIKQEPYIKVGSPLLHFTSLSRVVSRPIIHHA